MNVQQMLLPTLVLETAVMFAYPEQALESFTSAKVMERVPDTESPECTPSSEERRKIGATAEVPVSTRLLMEVVARPRRRMDVEETVAVKVPVAVSGAPKMMEGEVLALTPELFKMVRLKNWEVPVMVPVAVCWEVPFKKTRPELWVKMPLFK